MSAPCRVLGAPSPEHLEPKVEIPENCFAFTDLLTPDRLRSHFSPTTLRRAGGYVRSGAVRKLDVHAEDPAYVEVSAEVTGTHPWPYLVDASVELDGRRLVVESDCDCPVSVRCKHGAAALLRLGELLAAAEQRRAVVAQSHDRPAASLRLLDTALDQLDRARSSADRSELALSFSRDGGGPGVGTAICVRALRRGARDNWVRGGVSWQDLLTGPRAGLHSPGQADSLRQLASALRSASGGPANYYWQPPEHPRLGQFDGRLWGLLRTCAASGVELLAGPGVASVELLDTPLRIEGDVRRAEEGLRLELGARCRDRWWPVPEVELIGSEAHGVALIEPAVRGGDPAEGSAGVRLLLAALEQPLPELLTRLVVAGPTVVPADESDGFLANPLPRLARHLPVRSGDDSVVIPDPPAPVLTLAVTWGDPSGPRLRWGWVYRVAGREWACELGSGSALDGIRDRPAEPGVLAGLAEVGVAVPLPEQVATPDVLDFAERHLPALRLAGVEVTEEERPDFRPARGPVAIRFDAAESEDDGAAIDWLDLTVSIVVDGERVPLPELLAALTLGHPRLVLPSGLHLSTDRPEFEALREVVTAAAELRDADPSTSDRLRIGGHDLGLWGRIADIAETDVLPEAARDWVSRARALRDFTGLPQVEPKGVVSTLRGYQLDGFRWLAFLHEHGLGGILADDMGLGKTVQTLALIAHARTEGAAPFLVVAPSSVVSNWRAEAERHVPDLRVGVMSASQKRLGVTVEMMAAECDVVVTTYTLLRLEVDAYADLPWGGLVCDEAQQIKNHTGKTNQAVRRIRAPFRLAVTGTPFENRLMEIWALFAVVAPGLYPSAERFAGQVVRPVEKHGDEAALARFRQRLRPFVLRRTKELVAADLPPKQEQVLEVELSARHRKVYDTHLARERQKILGLVSDFGRNRVAIFSALTRLRQLSLDPALVDPDEDRVGSAKIDVLAEHLHELVGEGHRALVFSQFTGFLRRVRDRLDADGIDYAYLDGRTRNRDRAIERFTGGESSVFLISLKAGGVGLTLTEADYVFVLDPWWNPAVEAQAVDRAHRIGQTRPVMVYRLVAARTIEEKVMALKERKAALFAQVVDGEGGLGGVIDAEDVRGLFG